MNIVIIPAYNEAESIEKTILSIFSVLKDAENPWGILIFDSHSTDNTVTIVNKLQQRFNNLFLTTEPKKSGLGNAYLQAMRYAITELNADVVFEYDADGSHQAKHIPEMLEAIEKGADVVLGSRYVPGGRIDANWPWYRLWVSRLGNWTARAFLTLKYRDFTSGFRATKTSFLKSILEKGFLSNNYAYKIHLLWALHQAKANIVEVPIHFIDRSSGYSKFPKNNISESLRVVFMLRLRAVFRPRF